MIRFFTEDIAFKLKDSRPVKNWIKQVLTNHKVKQFDINYIFCADEYILKINRDFLQHDFYTDIITFDNTATPKKLASDIFISIERVTENAKKLNTTFDEELHRVLIHGILHLLGFKDKTAKEKQIMRDKENESLQLRKKHYIRV